MPIIMREVGVPREDKPKFVRVPLASSLPIIRLLGMLRLVCVRDFAPSRTKKMLRQPYEKAY